MPEPARRMGVLKMESRSVGPATNLDSFID